ncbi:MAG TPA: type II toxin-antitoxin system RelE/ParE family toxin [Candidatus Limnocylindrales bacterium]|nr:type II toxin-antitoxin system RelE/ParE family toxin [Candidatus Limnocylindrales bacterium]
MHRIVLARRAERDLRQIGSRDMLARIGQALDDLATGGTDLDIRPLVGSPPWHRLRVGDYRVLYRPVAPDEAMSAEAGWLIARIVHRRDLGRAVGALG